MPRRGFTLLEVLLALALSVTVMGVVAMAIRVNLRVADVSRTEIEQSQTARALMNRMADDLRSAVRNQPVNTSSIVGMQSSASSAALTAMLNSGSNALTAASGGQSGTTGTDASGATAAAAGGMGQTTGASGGSGSSGTAGSSSSGSSSKGSSGSSSSGGSSMSGGSSGGSGGSTGSSGSSSSGSGSSGSSSSSSAASTTTPVSAPGLFGSQSELRQLDVSPARAVGTGGFGGMKTISYSMQPSVNGVGNMLVRHEMDRAVAAFSSSQGGASADGGETLADNITDLEFRYFDGTDWQTDWDSDAQNRLPSAVEIVMSIAPPPPPGSGLSGTQVTSADVESITYRMVVQLPTSTPPPDDGSTDSGSTDSTGSDSGSTGSSGSDTDPTASSGSGSSSNSGSGSSRGGGSSANGPGGGKGPGGGTPGGGTPGGGTPGGGKVVAPPAIGAPGGGTKVVAPPAAGAPGGATNPGGTSGPVK